MPNQTVVLRPKTEEAKSVLETYGDVWEVYITAPDAVYGSVTRLMLKSRSDERAHPMWVKEQYDELFEVIYQ